MPGPKSIRAATVLLAAFVMASAQPLSAQSTPASEMDVLNAVASWVEASNAGPPGTMPLIRGFNASVGMTSQYDSLSGGWWLLTPTLAYRLNRHFSLDLGTPIYLYVPIYENAGTTARPAYRYVIHRGLLGDTHMSLRGNWYSRVGGYSASASLALPTGQDRYGLGAGEVTYDLNNHLERDLRWVIPEIELGEGNTSTLVDPRIRKDYISVGPIAHFQAGISVPLPHAIYFDAEAYEELPLAQDLVYSTRGAGKKKVTTSTNVGPAEDNGMLSTLDIPLSPHVVFSGFYSHSIRNNDDVGGFTLTFLLRGRHPE